MSYSVLLHPEAAREFAELDGSLRKVVTKKIRAIGENPSIGLPLGNEANLELAGLYKVYVDKKRIRIVYEIRETEIMVFIFAIGKREEMEVYRDADRRRE